MKPTKCCCIFWHCNVRTWKMSIFFNLSHSSHTRTFSSRFHTHFPYTFYLSPSLTFAPFLSFINTNTNTNTNTHTHTHTHRHTQAQTHAHTNTIFLISFFSHRHRSHQKCQKDPFIVCLFFHFSYPWITSRVFWEFVTLLRALFNEPFYFFWHLNILW